MKNQDTENNNVSKQENNQNKLARFHLLPKVLDGGDETVSSSVTKIKITAHPRETSQPKTSQRTDGWFERADSDSSHSQIQKREK